jgi:hypothetical protein
MTTTLSGRVGGQYSLELVSDNRYRVSGSLFNEHKVTIFTGDYDIGTKILDYCVIHDGEAQTAMQKLYIEGDPTMLTELHEHAKASTEARTRRRIGLTVEIETDVLEGENSIAIATNRLSAACVVAGMRVGLIQSYYADHQDADRDRDLGRIARERDFLLDHFVETEDGFITLPDGMTLPCRRKGVPANPDLVRHLVLDKKPEPPKEPSGVTESQS